MTDALQLSRRERQIMDVIYASGECSAVQVHQQIADAPSRTAIRTLLRILENKGHLTHRKSGREFIYRPTRPHKQAARSAFRRLLTTFFGGSIEQALASYLSDTSAGAELTPDELRRLRDLIEGTGRKG